ncbi:hypothetical protein HB162lentus_01970 [Mammaliicoccus lentus]
MYTKEDMIKEVKKLNSDINLHEEMIKTYLKDKLEDEYIVGAYNNFYGLNFITEKMERKDEILILTNKRAHCLKKHYYEDIIEYEKIDHLQSNIKNENTDLDGLIYIAFGKENKENENETYDDLIFQRYQTYYDNAKVIIDDLYRILAIVKNNTGEKILPMTKETMSYVDTINTDTSYFDKLSKSKKSLEIYKEMLDNNLISEEQYKLLT